LVAIIRSAIIAEFWVTWLRVIKEKMSVDGFTAMPATLLPTGIVAVTVFVLPPITDTVLPSIWWPWPTKPELAT
jgi:hypothetical protein